MAGDPSEQVDIGINLSTLMKRLEAVTSRLEDLEAPTSSRVSKSLVGSAPSTGASAGPAAGAKSSGSATNEETPLSPAVKGFDDLQSEHLQQFMELSSGIGGLVQEQAALVEAAFQSQRTLILVASQAVKPDLRSADFQKALKPLQENIMAIGELKDKNRPSPLYNHLSVVAEGIPALFWVAVEPTPAPHVGDLKDSAQFWANRVIKEFKEKDPKQVTWVRSFVSLLTELQKYVKQWHTTGLTWSPKGKPLADVLASSQASTTKGSAPQAAAGGAPPPPPPGPPPPPFMGDASGSAPAAASSGSDMNAVFAALNQGSSVTSGLKKVEKAQMTHKNPALRASFVVPNAKKASPATTRAAAPTTKKPARKELEGTKWLIEHFEGETVTVDEIELNHSVYVYNCKNTTVQIKGKFNAISLDGCTKTGVVVDTLVSSVDLIKCKSFAVQVLDRCPTIVCDSCDSGQIYLSQAGLACEILTSKCSSVNVSLPTGSDGDFKEEAVPEMLKHTVVDGKLVTSIVEYHD